MEISNSPSQQCWFEGLPGARIPYGDEATIKRYFASSELANELSAEDFLFAVEKRLFIEWCGEQKSKGLPANTSDFDYGIFEIFIADEMQYEFERSTLPDERFNREKFYEVRNRVLEAFVQNAVEFLKENRGIDGVRGNTRNLRCDLRYYIETGRQNKAA